MEDIINAIKRSLKKHDLFMKMFCWCLIKIGYSNYELQALQISNKKFIRLNKKYKKFLDELEIDPTPQSDEINNNVWVCWFQGIENAPEIVKKCNESVRYYLYDKDIHIITEENMCDYVDLPPYILEKFQKKIIAYAQMADILRTMLLVKYGGMWLDGTVFLTDKIPEYVYSKPLFLLHYKFKDDLTIVKNNWFIYSQKENRILKAIMQLLFEYWRKENILREYFLWHNFMKMALEKYDADADNIYYVSEEMAHDLGYALYKKYDPVYWEQIKRWSTIHKLSYYIFHTKDGKMPKDTSGTFYEYIMNMDFGENYG